MENILSTKHIPKFFLLLKQRFVEGRGRISRVVNGTKLFHDIRKAILKKPRFKTAHRSADKENINIPHMKPNKRLARSVSTYFGTVETNGRGMLHLHCLVWLRGAYPMSELRQKMCSDLASAKC